MRNPDGSHKPEERNPCPICGAETTLAECVPHPLESHFEIHGYFCRRCGPVKSLVVRAYPEARAAARRADCEIALSDRLSPPVGPLHRYGKIMPKQPAPPRPGEPSQQQPPGHCMPPEQPDIERVEEQLAATPTKVRYETRKKRQSVGGPSALALRRIPFS
jgi:hypothetical protein